MYKELMKIKYSALYYIMYTMFFILNIAGCIPGNKMPTIISWSGMIFFICIVTNIIEKFIGDDLKKDYPFSYYFIFAYGLTIIVTALITIFVFGW